MKTHQQKQSWEKWTRWAQQGNPSSHWTIAVSEQWFFAALVIVFFCHIWFAVILPPAEDELYYWNWSRSLQLSYYDHPPLTAILIKLSRGIFGEGMLGIRFFACLVSSVVIGLLGLAVRNKQLLTLVLFIPILFWGGSLMTPDVPLMLFWTLYVLWLQNVSTTLSEWSSDPVSRVYRKSPVSGVRWLMGGLILGLGLFSKYTMVLAVPCAIFALLFRYRMGGWLMGFLFHLFVAGLFCVPVLYWNWQHDWASFHFQWGHAVEGVGWSFDRFVQFLGSQVALVGLLPFLMLPWIFLVFPQIFAEPKAGTHWAFYAPLILFFLLQSMRKPLEANWAMVAYIAFWPLAQRLLDHSSFKGLARIVVFLGFLPAFAVTVLIGAHLITPVKWIKPEQDRMGLLKAKLELSRQIAKDLASHRTNNEPYVLAYNYQWVSYLRYNGWKAEQVPGYGRRNNYSMENAPDPCTQESVIVLQPVGETFPMLQCFPMVTLLSDYPVIVRGNVLEHLALRQYTK